MKKSIILFTCTALIVGCASNFTEINRADETVPLNSDKATIVGFISEGYITQPHGLNVVLNYKNKNPEEIKTLLVPATLGVADEVPSKNILGNTFIFQVPAGEYEISHWYYTHYNGLSKEAPTQLKFNVNAGEVAYIGHIHGNALTMCLSNKDNYNDITKEIKISHPVLSKSTIINKSTGIQFSDWSHDKSTDIMGKGLCKIL